MNVFSLLFLIRYDPTSGKFVADRAGMYFFEIYWEVHWSYPQYMFLRKNGDTVCLTYGDGTYNSGDYDYNGHSCSSVMDLVLGDEVFATTNMGYDVFTAGFNGFLVKPYV